jgi:hypothetical protein
VYLILVLGGCDLIEKAFPDYGVDLQLSAHGSDDPAGAVAPWDVLATLPPGSIFTSAPAGEDVGPLLFIDALARQSGVSDLLALSVLDLDASGGPFVLDVILGGGAPLLLEPVAPAVPPECAIPVDPAALDADAHAADLLSCIRSWVDANGAPTEPTLTFSVASRAAGASYGATLRVTANERYAQGCRTGTSLPADLTSNADEYVLKDTRLAGFVGAVDAAASAWVYALVRDPDGVTAASAVAALELPAGGAAYLGESVPVSDPVAAGLAVAPDPVQPDYLPPGDAFGAAVEETMLHGAGAADACWGALSESTPNTLVVDWRLLGTGLRQL